MRWLGDLRLASLPVLLLLRSVAMAYPVIVQVDEEAQRCFRFNVPDGDDAHLIALAIPSEDDLPDEALEAWYVDQVFAVTKTKSKNHILAKVFRDSPPDHVAEKMSSFVQQHNNDARTNLQITGMPASDPTNYQHTYKLKFFIPQVINYVSRTTDARARRHRNDASALEGYGLCLTNLDENRQVQIVFDLVLVSEEVLDDDETTGQFAKEEHLTPLEDSLQQSIVAAETVLLDMKHMEKREIRMRKTADSINSRVRFFGYLSVSVLLSVTYVQVSYLKRYFQKKKLM